MVRQKQNLTTRWLKRIHNTNPGLPGKPRAYCSGLFLWCKKEHIFDFWIISLYNSIISFSFIPHADQLRSANSQSIAYDDSYWIATGDEKDCVSQGWLEISFCDEWNKCCGHCVVSKSYGGVSRVKNDTVGKMMEFVVSIYYTVVVGFFDSCGKWYRETE